MLGGRFKGLVFLTAFLLALLASGCSLSKVEMDNEQGRLDKAAPLVQGPHTVGQTFVSHYPRLNAVEVLLVVYPDEGQTVGSHPQLTFHLRSDPQSPRDLATVTVDAASLEHNATYRFTFAPQLDSEGRAYTFFLEGTEGNRVTVWYNTLDAYGQGAMVVDGRVQEGDLNFRTYYDYNLTLIARDLWRGLASYGWLIPSMLALLLVPGYVVHSLLVPDEELDPIAHLALVVGLSLALTPLFLLFTTLARIRLNGPRVALAVGLLALLALWRLVATRFRDLRCWAGAEERPYVLGMAFVLGLTLGVRFLQVRGLVVPAWVDSVHHTLIAQVMVERGGVPGGYEPYLPVGEFTYHFGFHGLVALWHWLTGLEVVKAVLVVGQVVNGLMGLGVYLLVERVTGDRMGGLVGALVVGLVSWMPGYYVTWGRYTQLMGMAMMPVVMVLTLEGLEGGWREVVLAGVGVGGLGLTHYRVLVFYGCWVVVVLMCERRRVVWERGVGIGLVAFLLTLPWWLRLAAYLMPTGLLAGYLQSSPSFNAVPRALIGVGGDRILFPLAACGLLWGLFRRERVAILILLWVALLLLITNPSLLGLSSTWLLSNSSLVISLFLPIAILVGYLAASLRQFIAPRLGHWAGFARYGVSLLIVLVALWGAWGMLSVVNPVTVLATRDDMEAMAWIREQTPRDAKFLINARHWQEGAYMGSDGGYWIPLLTGRQTTLPAVVYVYGPPSYVKRISTLAKTVAEANSLKDEGLLRLLEEERITHVYLGARGGSLTPQMFLDDPGYRLVYSNGAAWIFAVTRRG